jgi:hypothetical protein
VKERPIPFTDPMVRALLAGTKTQTRRIVKGPGNEPWKGRKAPPLSECPYGVAGERLWVREAYEPGPRQYLYRASTAGANDRTRFKWKTGRYMPREASRIALVINDVRAERLFALTEKDAQAEGLLKVPGGWSTDAGQPVSESARRAFEDLWYSIHGSWTDCWVWVVQFTRISP